MEKLLPILGLVAGIITSLGTLFGQPFLYFTTIKRRKKIRSIINTDEIKEVLDKCDDKFITPEITENCFYSKTLISTNFNSIDRYIELKNKLGLNYNWKSIKYISAFISLEQKETSITIRKNQKIFYFSFILVFLIMIINSFFFLTSNSFFSYSKSDELTVIILDFLVLIFGISILMICAPFIQAMQAEKRLILVSEVKANNKNQ